MKKVYVTPKVNSEKVELGVFGCYGSSAAIKEAITPFKIIASLFKVFCCN